MSNVKSYSLEELAKHHDTTLSNVSRYVSERDYSELQQRNAELAAQVERLLDFAQGIAEGKSADVSLYGVMAFSWFNQAEYMINITPAQCLAEHDREVAARAGKAGFIDGAMSGVNWEYSGRYEISEDAEQYANKIKSGEVEL